MTSKRKKAREFARVFIERGDPIGWFEPLYASAEGDANSIPWADLRPNPNLVEWLDSNRMDASGKKALKIGCGLGDDAEELARRGFDVTAFDISPTAIEWCIARFPDSTVKYTTADLFDSPVGWDKYFDLVVEINTLQVLPFDLRPAAMDQIARFAASGGTLIAICRGRDLMEDEGLMPWPLLADELAGFKNSGLKEVSFEDFLDRETPPARRFRAVYRRT
ncbi:class I SAM-dependent methyltransferase [Thermodesulfobacteriota bacterium]